jgi:hypothetical protein
LSDYQYGVLYEGRDLGWVACEDLAEARLDLSSADEKYLPGAVGRRLLGPIEILPTDTL